MLFQFCQGFYEGLPLIINKEHLIRKNLLIFYKVSEFEDAIAEVAIATAATHRVLLTDAANVRPRTHPILVSLVNNLRVLIESENPGEVQWLKQISKLAILRAAADCPRCRRHYLVVRGLEQTSQVLLLPRLHHALLGSELAPQLAVDVVS